MNNYSIKYFLIVLTCIYQECHTGSLGKVAGVKKNVYKNIPDWALAHNGPKVKEKRLAPPMNYILKSAIEPSGFDDYEKYTGSENGEDESIAPDVSAPEALFINHTDIHGIVNYIKDTKPTYIANAINDNVNEIIKSQRTYNYDPSESTENPSPAESKHIEKKSDDLSKEITVHDVHNPRIYVADGDQSKEQSNFYNKINRAENKKSKKNDEYDDVSSDEGEEDAKALKAKQEEEANKALAMESVDLLKQKHAQEQNFISEKFKIDDLFLNHMRPKVERKKNVTDYDDDDYYDSASDSLEDKYIPKKKFASTKYTSTTYPTISTTEEMNSSLGPSTSERNDPTEITGQFLFDHTGKIIDVESMKVSPKPRKHNKDKLKESSKHRKTYKDSPPDDNDQNNLISLVPADDGNEPTLFFPVTKKQRKKKTRTTQHPSSYHLDEKPTFVTSSEAYKESAGTTAMDSETAPSSTASDSSSSEATVLSSTPSEGALRVLAVNDDGSKLTEASTQDAVSTDNVVDVVSASSDHDKAEVQDQEHKRGGGKEYHSEHEEEKEEHGKKAYKGHHEDSKSAKGHHDKEAHHGKYKDKEGHKKKHHDEEHHFGEHHHEENGKKHAKYEEAGKHSKGHSTKGSHDVHKKEEYEKKVEFFEEEGDSSEEEKHHGYHKEKAHKEGGHFKKGDLKADHNAADSGKSKHFKEGGHHHELKGHKEADGYDGHGKRGSQRHHEEGQGHGKKWVYHHGSPARTAGLVRIDRRQADPQSVYWPEYFGFA